PPADSSSDLHKHITAHRAGGPGVVVHAHPPGTVTEAWRAGEPHGVYARTSTLIDGVAGVLGTARGGSAPLDARAKDDRPADRWLSSARAVEWEDGVVRILDQTRLPMETPVVECKTQDDDAGATRRMALRAAP